MRVVKGRRVQEVSEIERPGDYCLTNEANADGEHIGRGLWYLLPIADPADPYRRDHSSREAWVATRRNGLHRIAEPPWAFREFEDGSVEVQPSILVGPGEPEGEVWHGYLNRGHEWQTVGAS